MRKKHILGIVERSLLFALVLSVIVSFSDFNSSCESLRNDIFRIHILANSDLEKDQNVKLKVRDSILECWGDVLGDCSTKEDAEIKARQNIGKIKRLCDKTLVDNGFAYTSEVTVGKSFFETRDYGTFTLPAGTYDSLIVTLGEGNGHNWWCVIYPSVCLGGSKSKLKKIGKKSQICLNPKKYKIRFKTLEIYEKIKAVSSKR